MDCILCRWICDRFCPPEMGRDAFWDYVIQWDRGFGSSWEPCEEETVRERSIAADDLFTVDRPAAIREFAVLAEQGSVWSARWLSYCYEVGEGVEQDLKRAEEYSSRALQGGSWMASLELAKLLCRHSINERWEAILADGDEQDFVPSTFWLAWYRYKRDPERSTARAVRPLLEKAALAGQPGARYLLARWKIGGKFGFGEIPQGFRDGRAVMQQFTTRELPTSELGTGSEREAVLAR